jgi:prepilin-type processing-associated H-X9-DG protein
MEESNKFALFDFRFDTNGAAVNAPARRQDAAIFLCPSDPSTAQVNNADGTPMGRTNYVFNAGRTADSFNRDGSVGGIVSIEFTNAQFNTLGNKGTTVKLTGITDGTSNTAMSAEILRGYNEASTAPLRRHEINRLSPAFANNLVYDPACASPGAGTIRNSGLQYYRMSIQSSRYTHVTRPNDPRQNCVDGSFDRGYISASSAHTGGVNAAFCDGSVRFFTNSIDELTWQLMGSRSDGQVFTAP